MRLLITAFFAAALMAASSAFAQTVDVSTITCKDFSAHKKDEMLAIMRTQLQMGANFAVPGTAERQVLLQLLAGCYAAALVDLHVHAPRYVATAGQKAKATPLARYQAQLVWGRDPILPEDGFDRLRRGLVSSGYIRRSVAYEACVDNSLAKQVIGE